MFDLLNSAWNLVAVVIGFGAVIFIHELGHFLAAKWAGIRVHEFAIGFGPPIFSWRRGIGFRMGSTVPAVSAKLKQEGAADSDEPEALRLPRGVSATEYRLNWLPLGGYVKMLGQEDLNPDATSSLPDSYGAKPVWKRLVVISAGVVMNVILAAILFVVVFMAGLEQPAPIVGSVLRESSAATAVATNAKELGVTEVGFAPGDRVLSIGDEATPTFNYVRAGAAMARKGRPVDIRVERPGVDGVLEFSVEPRKNEETRLLQLGVGPAISTRLWDVRNEQEREQFALLAERVGASELEPGMTVVAVDGHAVAHHHEIDAFVSGAEFEPTRTMRFTLQTPEGEEREFELAPRPEFQQAAVVIDKDRQLFARHLLGLAPAVRVGSVTRRAERQGLKAEDIIAQVNGLEWPNEADVVREISRSAGASVGVVVVRDGKYVDLGQLSVTGQGTVGFNIDTTLEEMALVTRPPAVGKDEADEEVAAVELALLPGAVILEVAGRPVQDFGEIRAELRRATQQAAESGAGASVSLRVRLPISGEFGQGAEVELDWALASSSVSALHELGWSTPLPAGLFQLESIVLKAENPVRALAMGHAETKRVIVMTYVTLLRLAQGSVKVEHLKGPVGIAHIGTQFVDQGATHLLFFLAIISANLAVLNFLPLPIVDGGHVVFLLIEWITRRPVSVAVQNAATVLGLVLLGSVFLIVTFNDLKAVFGL